MSIKASVTYQGCANDLKDEAEQRMLRAKSYILSSHMDEALQQITVVIDTLIPRIQEYERKALDAYRQEQSVRPPLQTE